MKWIVALLIVCAGPALAGQIDEATLDALPPADVIVLGEVHDNPVHHLNQARAVRALAPAAVVWEMLTPEQAAQMPEDRSDPAAVAEALDWESGGWPSFDLYAPILSAAGAARHFGANVPRGEARLAYESGAAAAFGDEAARYGLTQPLDAAQQSAREDEQFAAHCEAMPRDLMAGLVEAQRLRDAALARAVIAAHAQAGGPVVVITGSGHARTDWGLPATLAIAAPELGVLSVGQVESDPGAQAPWDLWIVTDPQPRPDPCGAFR
ncbi:MAG: ChaN family lipoprotein [Pararhodobacter sp.]